MYGEDARKPGTYAANCLLARRLCERGVRFIQLYHQGWDQHGQLPEKLPIQTKETDQASAALVMDLKQRGLLEDTIVVWGGEFGRTNYCQGNYNPKSFGRDHHPLCFSTWVAGGGFKGGVTHGETDDYCYNIVKDQVHVHDFHATLLNQLGYDAGTPDGIIGARTREAISTFQSINDLEVSGAVTPALIESLRARTG